ncbi:hypothetical protein FLW53_23495 [Microbispora sp. SCL1-1]|uniref:hypothetical protein n=1 Tax=unclassified Microbispora TaxID=2614687 RepID=UPI001156E78A|nr:MULTISPECIES: hypothetical protein [unclassified Microbispora]NJP27110.1 hypothetical protein [Microbispora sp. CL1-1]TQS11455.1 hypothetical protein FLW53_23495 [Microbispora sp. SCL1-1]
MSSFDPSLGITYGEHLRRKGIQVKGDRAVARTREPLDEHGRRRRIVTERTESGAIAVTTQRTDERGGEHQDVHIHAPAVVGVGTSSGQVIVP